MRLARAVSLDLLIDPLREMLEQFYKLALSRGLDFMVVFTSRTLLVQTSLYLQGRVDLSIVNYTRSRYGLYLLKEFENKYTVTNTLYSRHVIDELRPKARAFDIALLKDGKPTWVYDTDTNANLVPDYLELADLGKLVGLAPGAFWLNRNGKSSPDYPHYQLPRKV